MYVLKLRDHRAAAVVAVIGTIVIGLLLYRPVLTEEYRGEELVLLLWGEGRGRCGQLQGLDGRSYGPRSFGVDAAGFIYVADTFNQRIIVLDAGGVWVADFAVAWGGEAGGPGLDPASPSEPIIQDIDVDSQRNVYVADFGGTGIYKYDHVGNLLQYWSLNSPATAATADSTVTDLWVTERILVYRPGQVVVARTRIAASEYRRELTQLDLNREQTHQLAGTTVSESSAGGWKELEDVGRFFTFTLTRSGLPVTEWPAGPFVRTVGVWNKDGQLRWKTRVDSGNYIDEASLIGVDERGKVYLGVNLNQPDGVIYRLDADGVDYSLPIREGPEAVANVYARVNDRGDIYLMRPLSQGVLIEKLCYSRRWSAALRWD